MIRFPVPQSESKTKNDVLQAIFSKCYLRVIVTVPGHGPLHSRLDVVQSMSQLTEFAAAALCPAIMWLGIY
jgi:hypothetical protein